MKASQQDIAVTKLTHLLEREYTKKQYRDLINVILNELTTSIKISQADYIKKLEEKSMDFELVKRLLK